MVPLEFWQVFDVPHIIVIETVLVASNDSRVQRLGHVLRHILVLKFDPTLREILLLVATIFLSTSCNLGIYLIYAEWMQ